ncbi:MAG: putative inorganic polyphosphate/ATP-NAD kinase [Candidatus Xenolissoclinum pacificiensis L6]|uniref:Inorganic polyphosphate/ATP-NAD kinase n=1 Tax=Candidatus Xenolissoclinum pacificiensis L6 TaxID=1401685 RepID=W2V120_9RICK|nr:MAG: putative inorganic polyphosphate/ATP-NAD kinase [Candidatus Xenolissoclinum pacificiensis L6]
MHMKVFYTSSNNNKSRLIAGILEATGIINLDLYDCSSEIDLILVLGGDGFMLRSMSQYMHLQVPIYGINCGQVGFLLNEFVTDFLDHIDSCHVVSIHPLKVELERIKGEKNTSPAFNDVFLFRNKGQISFFNLFIDNKERLKLLKADGLIISTAIGSTAYNYSAGGLIMPYDSELIQLTPINPYYPNHLKSCLLSDSSRITVNVMESSNRPVSAFIDGVEFKDIRAMKVMVDNNKSVKLLFNSVNRLTDKILDAQFSCGK